MYGRRFTELCAWIIFAVAAFPRVGAGQESPADPVRAAVERRNAGDLTGAVQLLRHRLDEAPSDAQAIRLLAQTLYWLKQFDHARSMYDTALTRHPDNVAIRLEYARMLADLGEVAAARVVLTPLSGSPSPEARDLLRELALATAPWLRVGFEAAHDDQPLNRLSPSFEAGVFLTPGWTLAVGGRSDSYRSGDSLSRSAQSGEVRLKGYLAVTRLEIELSGGGFHRSFGGSSGDWTARVQGGFRLPGHLTIGGRAERKPYHYTTASLTIPIMVRELTALAALDDHSGWLGEAALSRMRYPDGNIVTSGYAWLMGPMLNTRTATFSVGYSFSAQNARESRFVLANPSQAPPPGSAGFDLTGRYVPYYTPDHVVAHSVIGSLVLHSGARTTISANGGWAFSAHEHAPEFTVSGAPPAVQAGTVRRSFTPWNARLAIGRTLATGWSVHAHAEHGRTAFYAASTAGVEMVFRFPRG